MYHKKKEEEEEEKIERNENRKRELSGANERRGDYNSRACRKDAMRSRRDNEPIFARLSGSGVCTLAGSTARFHSAAAAVMVDGRERKNYTERRLAGLYMLRR